MHRVESLVPEVLPHLVDPAEHPDDKALQIEFRRDAKVHLHPQRVVERLERTCVGAPRKNREDRRLHFERAVIFKRLPDRGDDLRAFAERFAHIGVRDEVRIALTVAQFRILQAMPLFRKGAKGLAEQRALPHMNRQLPALRSEGVSDDSNPVSRIHPFFCKGILLLPHRVELEVELQCLRLVREVGEHRLPVLPKRHDSSCGDDGNGLVHLVRFEVVEVPPDVFQLVLPLPLLQDIRVVPFLGEQPLQLIHPLADYFIARTGLISSGNGVQDFLFMMRIHYVPLSFQNKPDTFQVFPEVPSRRGCAPRRAAIRRFREAL